MKPPFLRKKSDGYVYPYTEMLAKRPDMEPYFPAEETADVVAEAAALIPEADPTDDDTEQEIEHTDDAPDEPVSHDYSAMHWKQLKRLVEDAGGEWSSKDAAIQFLTEVSGGE